MQNFYFFQLGKGIAETSETGHSAHAADNYNQAECQSNDAEHHTGGRHPGLALGRSLAALYTEDDAQDRQNGGKILHNGESMRRQYRECRTPARLPAYYYCRRWEQESDRREALAAVEALAAAGAPAAAPRARGSAGSGGRC